MNSKTIAPFTLVWLLASGSILAGEPYSLFGVELNSAYKTRLAACDVDMKKFNIYGDDLCRIDTEEKKAWGLSEFGMNLPKNKPEYLRGLAFSSKDDQVVAIYAYTYGIEHQDDVFDALVKKLGKPTRQAKQPLQSAFGERIQRRIAAWRLVNATVTFTGVTDQKDWGQVILESNEYSDILAKWKATNNTATLKP